MGVWVGVKVEVGVGKRLEVVPGYALVAQTPVGRIKQTNRQQGDCGGSASKTQWVSVLQISLSLVNGK